MMLQDFLHGFRFAAGRLDYGFIRYEFRISRVKAAPPFYFTNPFFLAKSQIKETNASVNKIKTDSISQISIIGSAIIFDNIILMININGIANKKIIPKAINFLVFPM